MQLNCFSSTVMLDCSSLSGSSNQSQHAGLCFQMETVSVQIAGLCNAIKSDRFTDVFGLWLDLDIAVLCREVSNATEYYFYVSYAVSQICILKFLLC